MYIVLVKCKPDWTQWLHEHKRREIEAVFKGCPEPCFAYGLELGAGDGFQSTLLTRYVGRVVSTEINPGALPPAKLDTSPYAGNNHAHGVAISAMVPNPAELDKSLYAGIIYAGRVYNSATETKQRPGMENVEYRICSAQEAVHGYPRQSFDFIFSSNLLEHIADPVALLRGVSSLLKDEGLTIHIMPSPFWKLCHMALYAPAHALVLVERITRTAGMLQYLREMRCVLRECIEGILTGSNQTLRAVQEIEEQFGNNYGIPRKRRTFLSSLFTPAPHGVSTTNIAEFTAFDKRRWLRAFDEAGLTCLAVRKGPAASGYGLGWETARKLARRLGLASEYIYVACKKGCSPRVARFFI